MDEITNKILEIIKKHKEGIKAIEIAKKLCLDKSKVNSILYSKKNQAHICIDENYFWHYTDVENIKKDLEVPFKISDNMQATNKYVNIKEDAVKEDLEVQINTTTVNRVERMENRTKSKKEYDKWDVFIREKTKMEKESNKFGFHDPFDD